MPAYSTFKPNALYPGDSIALVSDASVDSGVTTTQQFAFGPVPNQSGGTVVINNTTDQQAQGEYSDHDVDANYTPLSGFIIAPGASLPYNLSGGWLRFTFATAPTSGSLIVSR